MMTQLTKKMCHYTRPKINSSCIEYDITKNETSAVSVQTSTQCNWNVRFDA